MIPLSKLSSICLFLFSPFIWVFLAVWNPVFEADKRANRRHAQTTIITYLTTTILPQSANLPVTTTTCRSPTPTTSRHEHETTTVSRRRKRISLREKEN
jgi:hypothetical protein